MNRPLGMLILVVFAGLQVAADWTQFRSHDSSGVSSEAVPVTFDISDGTNLGWTADLVVIKSAF